MAGRILTSNVDEGEQGVCQTKSTTKCYKLILVGNDAAALELGGESLQIKYDLDHYRPVVHVCIRVCRSKLCLNFSME